MKINFTKKEFEALLAMIYLGDWMIHSHVEGNINDDYDALEQKILSYAKEYGLEDMIMFDEKLRQYFPTREYEESEGIQGVIDDYNNANFWDELINRLAARDLIKRFGSERLKAMKGKDRIELFWEAEKPYEDEFQANGIERLKIETAQP
jgi:hypothetical protein